MEHLPPVTNPFEPLSVPYIGDGEYDGLDFAGYPARRGFDIERLLKADFHDTSPLEIASFLQTWLFFGFLQDTLGVKISISDFVRTDAQGKQWVTTAKLPGVFQHFRQLINLEKTHPVYTPEHVEQRNDRIAKIFRLAQDVWDGFSRLEDRYSVSSPISPEISLSIQILGITLQVGATEICGGVLGGDSYRKVPWERSNRFTLTRNAWLSERMATQGWCPVVVEQVRTRYNVLGQYYTSLLGPSHRKLDHSNCKKGDADCEAMKQLRTGAVTHEVEGCQCNILIADKAKLADTINKNEIPVLCLIEENGIPALEIVSSSEPGLEYTAMSHVWTDGWGNSEENSLPFCRVDKLSKMIAASYKISEFNVEVNGEATKQPRKDKRVLFWMDTLCVPREPAHIHAKAIIQMKNVYAGAERVLVFDSELMASTAKSNYEEINLRILCSRWIRRLWTLQEAVLAKRLIFQFAERSHMIQTGSSLWDAREADLKLNYFNSIGWDCHIGFDYYRTVASDPLELMPYLWKLMLTDRAVTVQTDEPICGAILMNFDMKPLMEASEENRMQEFWRLHKDHIPSAILYVPSTRLKNKGFSWAPTSFLSCSYAGIGLYNYGKVTNEGLRIKFKAFSSFALSTPSPVEESIFPCTLNGERYFIKNSPARGAPWDGVNLHNLKDLAVLVEYPTVKGEDNRRTVDASRAVIVEIVNRAEEIFFAEYITLVSLIREGSPYHLFPNSPWSAQQIEQMAKTPCKANWIETDQEWYLV